MKRGLTILESLVALTLLAALAMVAAGWIGTAAHLGGPALARASWSAAADAVLRQISHDLSCGDFPVASHEPRARVIDDRLRVRTRTTGDDGPREVMRDYWLDPATDTLRLTDRTLRGSQPIAERPLISGIRQWQCAIDADGASLTVTLSGDDGHAAWTFDL